MAASTSTFYSELRRGAALGIQREDFSSPPTTGGARAGFGVSLTFDPTHVATANLLLVGPGDIVGIDPRTIVRTSPKADDNQAEAGFLAYVEFDQADFPWRYTPAKPQGNAPSATDRLRPWLSLLVLEEGVDFTDQDIKPPQGAAKLPLLTINDPGMLPDLAEVWAWAHVHTQGNPSQTGVPALLATQPGMFVARLMSPRRLLPQKAYRAFVVPTFKRGVKVGRGEDPGTTDALATAWPFDTGEATTLPIYHSWRFQTGIVTSFDEAARALAPVATLPESVGLRELDVSQPGLALDPPAAEEIDLGGALEKEPSDDPALSSAWTNGLADLIALGTLEGQGTRIVAPPLYGRWYAAEDHLDKTTATPKTNPPWFFDLNNDPRYRVAAALGTEVVQRDQQALMAAALEQGARLERMNRALKTMQAGREVFSRILDRHIATGPKSTVLSITSPVFGRVVSCAPGTGPKPTIAGILFDSPIGGGLGLPWRRLFPGDVGPVVDAINNGAFISVPSTPGGMATTGNVFPGAVPGKLPDPSIDKAISSMDADERLYWGVILFWVARKLLASEGGRFWWLLRKLLQLGLDLIALGSTQGVTYIGLLKLLRAGNIAGVIAGAPGAPNFTPIVGPDPATTTTWPPPRQPPAAPAADNTQATAFKAAATALLGYVSGTPLAGRVLTKVDVPAQVQCILTALSPAVTFVAEAKSRFLKVRTIAWQAADELEPVLVAPRIERPVWDLLRDISLDWILPGVGDVPRNSVSLVKTNQKFIEAFMTGLNHEVTRELIWNGHSVDQRGTYFHQFWDHRGWVKGKASDQERTPDMFDDVVPISSWSRSSEIGTHTARQPTVDHLVLLVRGDVIKRYPNVVVYAAKAKDVGGGVLAPDDTDQRHPVFQGILGGDIACYGFELTKSEVRGSPGWFFVLQEHPSEPKFNQLAPSGEVYARPSDYDLPGASATVAAIVAANGYDTPLRVAIHGKDLVPA
jgi:hypothetical protein